LADDFQAVGETECRVGLKLGWGC